MARTATLTRSRLLRAGEQRFARDGVTGARMSDVVRDAGQANDSAVGYHFGSRQGLLDAIVSKHVAAMDGRRALPSREAGLRALVDAIVGPTAHLLATEDGRDFLRITEGSPIRRIGHERWLRNVAVAAGNALRADASSQEPLRAALEALREHPSPLVREHVGWALST
jgi:AcrR family transcriptional regulator